MTGMVATVGKLTFSEVFSMNEVIEGKMCPNCYTFKPLSSFGLRMRYGKNIGQSYCIPCKRMLDRAYMRAKREK